MNALRNPEINLSLLKTISRQRLRKYFDETRGDLDAALTLYERNTRLAESLYAPLQCLEVCLRNVLNTRLAEAYGHDWMDRGHEILNRYAIEKIDEAKRQLPNGSHDDLVAELKFSFWVSLLGATYDATLWRRAIYKGFRAVSGHRRSVVHGRLNAIRRFRNRVAHYEPVFASALRMHDEIIEAIGWMCLDTKAWAEHQSCFLDTYRKSEDRN